MSEQNLKQVDSILDELKKGGSHLAPLPTIYCFAINH